MKYFKDIHLVLVDTKRFDEGDGIKVTLDTSEEELDYDINIDFLSECDYLCCGCTLSLKNLLYRIKDIIPYEWIADMKEDKNNEK